MEIVNIEETQVRRSTGSAPTHGGYAHGMSAWLDADKGTLSLGVTSGAKPTQAWATDAKFRDNWQGERACPQFLVHGCQITVAKDNDATVLVVRVPGSAQDVVLRPNTDAPATPAAPATEAPAAQAMDHSALIQAVQQDGSWEAVEAAVGEDAIQAGLDSGVITEKTLGTLEVA